MYFLSTIPVTLGLLLITVSQTWSMRCVVCEGTGSFSKCESDKRANTTVCSPRYPYCAIETRESDGAINLVRRRCSNRTLTLTHNPKMKLLNPKTNVTLCVFYYDYLICASLCDKDLCNSISVNRATLHGGDSKLLQCSLLLSVFLVFDFTRILRINS